MNGGRYHQMARRCPLSPRPAAVGAVENNSMREADTAGAALFSFCEIR
jgi:hypothetical protein